VHIGLFAPATLPEHEEADHDHDGSKQHEQALPIGRFPQDRPDPGAHHARERKNARATPFHGAVSGMQPQIDYRVGGNGDRASSDRDVRGVDADDINQHRDGQDGPTASDEAQHQANQCTGKHSGRESLHFTFVLSRRQHAPAAGRLS
jgi:hypothetical protein